MLDLALLRMGVSYMCVISLVQKQAIPAWHSTVHIKTSSYPSTLLGTEKVR